MVYVDQKNKIEEKRNGIENDKFHTLFSGEELCVIAHLRIMN